MRVAPFQLVSSGVMGANITSSAIDLQQVWIYSVQAYWTGAPVGEMKLQASNDLTPETVDRQSPYFNPTHWTDIAGTVSSTGLISSANFMWNVDSPAYRWVRFVYRATTATGTLTVNAVTKGY